MLLNLLIYIYEKFLPIDSNVLKFFYASLYINHYTCIIFFRLKGSIIKLKNIHQVFRYLRELKDSNNKVKNKDTQTGCINIFNLCWKELKNMHISFEGFSKSYRKFFLHVPDLQFVT